MALAILGQLVKPSHPLSPTMSSGKVHNLVGNIANQKYEASRNIERHIQIINHTSPSQETTRWKDSQPYYFTKQEGRLVVDEKRLNEDNLLMNQRLHNVAAENRTLQAHEHAPGWRAGKCESPLLHSFVLSHK